MKIKPITQQQRIRLSTSHSAFRRPHSAFLAAFTILELLVVVAIIGILTALMVPAFTQRKTADDITNAAFSIKGMCEQARSYAKANHTYAWIGFYEENTSAAVPTNATPAYPGKGKLVLASVFSKDGTKILEDGDPSPVLPPSRITQLGKLIKIEGVHLTDIGAPSGGNPDSLDGRSGLAYTEGAPFSHFNRISSDSTDATQFAFTTQGYTFYKTVRFSPRGEANINSTYTFKHAGEIALRPTHGDAVDNNSRNVVAIQFGAVGGEFKIYRK